MQVRDYCERQWSKILAGRVSAADFVFAKARARAAANAVHMRMHIGPHQQPPAATDATAPACPRTPTPPTAAARTQEVRLGSYSARAATIPPAAIVATQAMAADPRRVPVGGERTCTCNYCAPCLPAHCLLSSSACLASLPSAGTCLLLTCSRPAPVLAVLSACRRTQRRPMPLPHHNTLRAISLLCSQG